MINDRSATSPTGYNLYYGKIDYVGKTIGVVNVVANYAPATYFGAYLVHSGRVYYYGSSSTIVTNKNSVYPFNMGFINVYDSQETQFSCSNSAQVYNFTTILTTYTLTTVPSAMAWITTGYASWPTINTGKSFKSMVLTGGLNTVNFNSPMSNNTYCPIVGNVIGTANVISPSIPNANLIFNPDAATYPP